MLCVSKLLKFHTPIYLYFMFRLSNRKETLLITPQQVDTFVSNSSYLWNAFYRRSPEVSEVKNFATSEKFDKKYGHRKINFTIEDI